MMKTVFIIATSIFAWFFPAGSIMAGKQLDVVLTAKKQTTVYICNGKYATKYHAEEDCRGLNNCKSTISSITKEDAIKKGREECDICY